MAEKTVSAFVWIAPERTTKWTVKIGQDSSNLTDVRDDILSAKFPVGLVGEELTCEIELDNNSEIYTNLFQPGYEIYFYMDFSDGTTVQFRGILEQIQKKITGSGFTINIKGSHVTTSLLDITVTGEFNAEISSILTNIIGTYLTGFTTTNIQTTGVSAQIKWSNKPFLDCVVDLMRLSDFDCYIDVNKDFYFFPKNSRSNENEAVVWNDSLVELSGLGEDSLDVRNKIIVNGELDGLPVLHTSQDSNSQTTYGVKEKIVKETSITDEAEAEDLADAENSQLKNPPTKGEATCLFMPQLRPGDMLWVVSPPHAIQDQYRLVKYTFMVPDEMMTLVFSQEVGIAQLFKERFKKELGQQAITNPHRMTHSYNFSFDDLTKINEAASTDITVTDSKLKTDGASTGIMISQTKTTPVTVNNVHLLAKGEGLIGNAIFSISADGADTWQTISLDTLTTVTNPGTQLRLRIQLSSSTAYVDTVALLYKS